MTDDQLQPPTPDPWNEPQTILVILAHPDDPEFFCGATLALWASQGHQIHYCLLTCGDKGRNEHNQDLPAEALCAIRHAEQNAAAKILGVQSVEFLGYEDGTLVPDLALRRDICREIRRHRPQVIVTCDPQNLFASYGLNHPDHRAAGQAALDAIFPAAGNELFFPELKREGFEPHSPAEIWVSLTSQPNTSLDVTATWETKIRALLEHKSQIGEPEKLAERMRARHTEDSTDDAPRYKEKFKVLRY